MKKHPIDRLLDHAQEKLDTRKRMNTFNALGMDSSTASRIRTGELRITDSILARFEAVGMSKEVIAEILK
jgi:hypothetical protein